MSIVWVILGLILPMLAAGYQMPDELFYRTPSMYHLEDYDACLFHGNVFCLGEFRLLPGENSSLYQEMIDFSHNPYLPNRTYLHRGLCMTSHDDPSTQFQKAVDQEMVQNYGLRAKLRRLQYCKSKDAPGTRPIDWSDWLMATVIVAVILLNLAGTVYDFKRNPELKPNRLLIAWSLRNNWNRLTAFHSGDANMDALKVIHGIRVHQGMLVVCAHTMMALTALYVKDSKSLDHIVTSPTAGIGKTGTVIVQTFATLTSFLFAYTLLLHAEKTKELMPLSKAPIAILNRFTRMTPMIMFMVGVTATWVARMGDGPMWYLVQQLEADCRAKWWTHLFFINNLVNKEQRCMVQTWFIAVDMQVFIVAVVLTLLLLPKPRAAPRILLAVYAAVVATNLAINIKWQIVPMSTMSTLDNLRQFYIGLDSYNWFYSMPWTSLPASLHGLILAFVHYNQQRSGFNPAEHKFYTWLRVAIKFTYVALFILMFSGVFFEEVTNPLVLSVVATFERIVFNAFVTFLLWALFNNLCGVVNSYLAWSGFQVISRMALSTFLVHWLINLAGVAIYKQLFEISFFQFNVQFLAGLVLTYMLALPLHLMVEMPSQKIIDIYT